MAVKLTPGGLVSYSPSESALTTIKQGSNNGRIINRTSGGGRGNRNKEEVKETTTKVKTPKQFVQDLKARELKSRREKLRDQLQERREKRRKVNQVTSVRGEKVIGGSRVSEERLKNERGREIVTTKDLETGEVTIRETKRDKRKGGVTQTTLKEKPIVSQEDTKEQSIFFENTPWGSKNIDLALNTVNKFKNIERPISLFLSPLERPEKELRKGEQVFNFVSGNVDKTQPTKRVLIGGVTSLFGLASSTVADNIQQVRERPIQTAVSYEALSGFKNIIGSKPTRQQLKTLSSQKDKTVGILSNLKRGETKGKAITQKKIGDLKQVTEQEFVITPNRRVISEKIESTVFKGDEPIRTIKGSGFSNPLRKGIIKAKSGLSEKVELFKNYLNVDRTRKVSLSTSIKKDVSKDGGQFLKGFGFKARLGAREVTQKNKPSNILFYKKEIQTRPNGYFVFKKSGQPLKQEITLIKGSNSPTQTQTLKQTQSSLGAVQAQQKQVQDIALSGIKTQKNIPQTFPVMKKQETLSQTKDKKIKLTKDVQTQRPREDNIVLFESQTKNKKLTKKKPTKRLNEDKLPDFNQEQDQRSSVKKLQRLFSRLKQKKRDEQIQQQQSINQIGSQTSKGRKVLGFGIPSPEASFQSIPTQTNSKKQLFDVFARIKGEDTLIGSSKTREEAFSSLSGFLSSTLRASGFVTLGNKKLKPYSFGSDFRPSKTDPFRVVQKRSKRLSSSKEIFGIQRERKKKGRKKAKNWFS